LLTNLYFVRHAHSIYSSDESGRPLSQKGLADVKKVTDLLNKESIHVVISSPYKRAIQTVKEVGLKSSREIIIDNSFKERMLSKNAVEDFQTAISKLWEEPSFSWEGGESNLIAQKRGVYATLNTLERFKGKNIVVGSHGNLIALIMNYFDKQYDLNFWRGLDMPDIYKLSFDKTVLKEVVKIWHR